MIIPTKYVLYIFLGFSSLTGGFIIGRKTAPKTITKIQYLESKNNHLNRYNNGHIVTVTHKQKNGETTITKTVNFQSHSNSDTKINIQKEKTKSFTSTNSINYTFMVGCSLTDPKMDYIVQIGVPLFWGLFKANAGYEFNDTKIFVGATFNF